MGHDFDLFVYPDRISSQLICPICTLVLKNPVQTSTEHLFCEDELLEWMAVSTVCPVTNSQLNPEDIRKPGRIIANMLGELEMFCPNKEHGCKWVGQNEHLNRHLDDCKYQNDSEPKEEDPKITKIKDLTLRLAELEFKYNAVLEENNKLKSKLRKSEKICEIFSTFLTSGESNEFGDVTFNEEDYKEVSKNLPVKKSENGLNALHQLSRLRSIDSLDSKGFEDNNMKIRRKESFKDYTDSR